MMDEIPSIPEFYRDRKVLITGGSGFMGKVLIEKLLRSCPELHTVYLLLRPKKNTQPSMRIKQLIDVPLFDKIRRECPERLGKLVAVCGDVKELGLGLSEEDRRMLQDQVSVIFHSAASVRFDDPISDAILINVRGTREVINLALGMKDLKVFVHVSTAFGNCDQPIIYEKIYPARADWRMMIDIVERPENDHMLRCLTPKIIGNLPNTYIYAKSLTEQLINDYRHQLPLVIHRPSVVAAACKGPVPGWVDNFYGPVGLIAGIATGVLRVVLAGGDTALDYVPVDKAIRSIIYTSWHRAVVKQTTELPIYNCSRLIPPTTIDQVTDYSFEFSDTLGLSWMLWVPNPLYTKNTFVYYINVILFHLIPALVVDGVLKLVGRQPMLTKIQRKVYIANMVLSIFSTRNFDIDKTQFEAIESDMLMEDVDQFTYKELITDVREYIKTTYTFTRVYLMKDPLETMQSSVKQYKRMYWLDKLCKTTFFLTVIYVIGTSRMFHTWMTSLQATAVSILY